MELLEKPLNVSRLAEGRENDHAPEATESPLGSRRFRLTGSAALNAVLRQLELAATASDAHHEVPGKIDLSKHDATV